MTVEMDGGGVPLRVVIMSGVDAAVLERLIEQIGREVPEARVVGLLSLVPRRLSARERASGMLRRIRDPGYLPYALGRVVGTVRRLAGRLGTSALRFLHAYTPPGGGPSAGERLEALCRGCGIARLETSEVHAEESLAFVRGLGPDLGIVYGTPILRPSLFKIPGLGSINVHQRKVPEYRGGGPIGLWELLDGRDEIGVTIHRVLKRLDAGGVIRSATIPIGPYDTLESLALKAHVVSVDLLTLAVSDFARGEVREVAQEGESRMYRSPSARELRRHLARMAATRPEYPAARGWPAWKLLAKSVLYAAPAALRNRRRKRAGTFPVVVLFHHVIADRPHFMGLPTSQFLRQLEFLRRFYDVVDLETAAERLRSGRVEAPTVVLSFDDGYKDNLLTLRAAALGLGREVPATLFLSSAHITEGTPFAHDVERGFHDFPPLTWDEVAALEAYGYRVGSHTRTHFDCGSTDQGRLLDEIVESRREMEDRLGHPVPHFSYPYGQPGNISEESLRIARGAYDLVCSAYGGENDPGRGNPTWHVFRRSHPITLWELELALQSILDRAEPSHRLGEARPEAAVEAPVPA